MHTFETDRIRMHTVDTMTGIIDVCFMIVMLPSVAAIAYLGFAHLAPMALVAAVLRVWMQTPAPAQKAIAASIVVGCCYSYLFVAALGALLGLLHCQEPRRLAAQLKYGAVVQWESPKARVQNTRIKEYTVVDVRMAVQYCAATVLQIVPVAHAARRQQLLTRLDQVLDGAGRAVQRYRNNAHAAWQRLQHWYARCKHFYAQSKRGLRAAWAGAQGVWRLLLLCCATLNRWRIELKAFPAAFMAVLRASRQRRAATAQEAERQREAVAAVAPAGQTKLLSSSVAARRAPSLQEKPPALLIPQHLSKQAQTWLLAAAAQLALLKLTALTQSSLACSGTSIPVDTGCQD
jgi:hypothetical protein